MPLKIGMKKVKVLTLTALPKKMTENLTSHGSAVGNVARKKSDQIMPSSAAVVRYYVRNTT